MARKNFTDISIVLDRSGSMASVVSDTIGGFNTFLEEQQKAPGDAVVTLVQFDTTYEKLYESQNLKYALKLTPKTFVPRGGTALLDAIGRLIDETGKRLSAMKEEDRPSQIIFVILTDGEENSSQVYDTNRINTMITHQRGVYKWNFVFLGANQDAIMSAAKLGIGWNVSMSYAGTGAGTAKAFIAVNQTVRNYRAGGQSLMDNGVDYFADARAEQDKLIKGVQQSALVAPTPPKRRKRDLKGS